jgi:hypothetical protein
MKSFDVSPEAQAQIRKIIAITARVAPVVSLVDGGPDLPVPDAVRAAVRAPHDAASQRRAELSLREKFSVEKSDLQLGVVVNERSKRHDRNTVEIAGLLFAIGPGVLELLRPYTLTFKNGRFYLESEDEIVGALVHIKRLRIR